MLLSRAVASGLSSEFAAGRSGSQLMQRKPYLDRGSNRTEGVITKRNSRLLYPVLRKPGKKAQTCIAGCTPALHLQVFLMFCSQSISRHQPRRGGIRPPVESDLFRLTAELILRSKPGEVMDDLALSRQPTPALGRPGEGPVASPPFTINIIILGCGTLRA